MPKKKPPMITANELLAKAKAAVRPPGTKNWIDDHPHREAIIDAIRQGELGDTAVTRRKLDGVSRRIRGGSL